MNTQQFILDKYHLRPRNKQYVDIPNTNRETLAQLFFEMGFTKGAEVGVERGMYSEILLRNNPNLHLYSIDAWRAYKGYRDHVTQEACDALFQETAHRLAPYQDRNTLIRKYSMEAIGDFEDESLDFVYIDANHEFQHVVDDICEWQKKVKVGGIVAGHDYIYRKGNEYLMHVPYALQGYIDSYYIKPVFVLGRKSQVEGELRDRPRSWFYVKPIPTPIKPHKDTLTNKV